MRSSSSPYRADVVHGGGELSAWAPDLVSALKLGEPEEVSYDEAEMEAAIDAAVAEAIEAERAASDERVEELRREFEAEAERIAEEAYERGRSEGRNTGEEAEGARLRTAVRAAEEALDALREGEVRWTGTIEENIIALSVAIARHVIGRELTTDVEPVAELVRNALEDFPIDQPIRIRIHPSDLNALGSVGVEEGDPLRKVTGEREARWLPDASIAPGGCVVEGRERIVDGRVDTALERVYRRLTYTNA